MQLEAALTRRGGNPCAFRKWIQDPWVDLSFENLGLAFCWAAAVLMLHNETTTSSTQLSKH